MLFTTANSKKWREEEKERERRERKRKRRRRRRKRRERAFEVTSAATGWLYII